MPSASSRVNLSQEIERYDLAGKPSGQRARVLSADAEPEGCSYFWAKKNYPE